jgi:hypothetical protein
VPCIRPPLRWFGVGDQRDLAVCSRSAINPVGVEVHQDGLEVRIVEDALEDRLVVVHAADDGVEELPVKHQPEVVECVVLGLGGDLGVGEPSLLELIEEKLVLLIEFQTEALVQALDDLRQRLHVRLILATCAVPVDGFHFAALVRKRERALIRDLVPEMGQFHLGPKVEPLDSGLVP